MLSFSPYKFLIFFAMWMPTFSSLLPGYSGQYLALFATLAMIFLLISSLGFRLNINEIDALPFVYFAYFFLITGVSIIREQYQNNIAVNDIFELIRPFYILLFFIVFRMAMVPPRDLVKQVKSAYVLTFILFVFWSFFETLGGDLGRQVSFLLYKRDYKEIIADKAVGSFGLTYYFAYVLIIPLFYSFFRLLMKPSIFNSILFFLFVVSLLLTQSRTMFLAMVTGLVLVLFIPFLYSTRMWRTYFLFSSLAAIFVGVFVFMFWEVITNVFGYVYNGISSLIRNGIDLSGQGSGSANIRVAQLVWVFQNMDQVPLIGSGIGKGDILLESVYALYLYRYGVLGLVMLFTLLTVLALKSYKIAKHYYREDKDTSAFFLGLTMFYVLSPIGLLSSASHDSPRVAFVFYGLAGLIFYVDRFLAPKSSDLSILSNKRGTKDAIS